MDIWVEVLLEPRMLPGAWNLGAVDLWFEDLLQARVQPGAWNFLSLDLWVELLLQARGGLVLRICCMMSFGALECSLVFGIWVLWTSRLSSCWR